MKQFVCVRMVQGNGMDLGLFQFDYDMSFNVTFLNADHTLYGRYGSRRGNDEMAHADLSMEGLLATMEGVLALHADYPNNRSALAGKQAVKPAPVAVPEAHPLLGKYPSKLDYEGKVAGSCVHCHMIREVERRALRDAGELLPSKLLTPYPMPSVLGLELDPRTRATVKSVVPGSPAAVAELREGDAIIALEGEPIVSLADIQWVLHQQRGPGTLTIRVERDGVTQDRPLRLTEGWDRGSDIAWRVTTWDLRRMAFGGLFLVSLSGEERRVLGIADGRMALRAKHVGQYGEHAVAKNAGLKVGDVIVAFDGNDADVSESELLRRVLGTRRRGEKVTFRYLRGQEERSATISLQ